MGHGLVGSSKEKGRIGEEVAVRYLKKKGYHILDRNALYYQKEGPANSEIDIVAKKDGCIVFVEVKTSFTGSGKTRIAPEERVDIRKRKHIHRGLERWLMSHRVPLDARCRVDVLGITIDALRKKARVSHFENIAI